jgi:hypothetical protein
VLSRCKGWWIPLLVGALVLSGVVPHPPARADGERLVLAFYYAWYDQKTWKSGRVPDVPAEPYVSANRSAITRHVDQARGAGIDALVLNWWGRGNPTEKNLKTLLDVASQKGLRVAVDFDINSPFMKPATYAEHLHYLHTTHAAHPAYLRWQGRPVVFFYNVSRLSVATWRALRNQADPERKALWIAEGTDLKYLSVFDGHHLYSVAWRNNIPPAQTLSSWGKKLRKYNREHGTDKLWVATVMPGYDDRKARAGGFIVPRNGGAYYRNCWQAAIDSRPDWVIVNSFNEWPEGTYVEPSQAHGSFYLDLTREWAARFKAAEFAADAVQPASTPTRIARPTPQPTLRPTPIPTPTPPPRPPVRLLPYPPDAVRGYLAQGCGYVLADMGAESVWIVLCPFYTSPDAVPLLVR